MIQVNKRDFKSIALGVDLTAYSPQDFRIASIGVDNRSGSWLYVQGLDQYVPPYTLGWKRNLPQTTQSITIQWSNGPSGSSSQLSGDGAMLWMQSYRDTDSDGIQYYAARQPNLREAGTGSGNLLPGGPAVGQNIIFGFLPGGAPIIGPTDRCRVYTLTLGYYDLRPTTFIGARFGFAQVNPLIVGSFIGVAMISPNHPVDRIILPIPQDGPPGYGVRATFINHDTVDTVATVADVEWGKI